MNNSLPMLVASGLVVFLGGCSSAPQPVAVDFNQKPEVVNSRLPRIIFFDGALKSARVDGPWTLKLKDFKGNEGSYDAAAYYALAHADLIELDFNDQKKAGNARLWLQNHGATAPIQTKAQLAYPVLKVCGIGSIQPSECDRASIIFYKFAEVNQ